MSTPRDDLIEQAQQQFRDWPHLAERYADEAWQTCVVQRRIWRFGKAFAEKGEMLLARPAPEEGFMLVHSNAVMVDVTVPDVTVRLVA